MKTFKVTIPIILFIVIIFFLDRSCTYIDKVTDVDNAIANYEEFQSIYKN